MSHIATLLRRRASNTHLRDHCFVSEEGKRVWIPIERFHEQVYHERWDTVAFCALKFADVDQPLRWGWSLRTFRAASSATPQQSSDGTPALSVNLDIVDAAVGSTLCWSWLMVFRRLCVVVHRLVEWGDACTCHWGKRTTDKQLQRVWSECCFRGMRVPELACGDFNRSCSG